MEACWAHNPEVRGSKPRSANAIAPVGGVPRTDLLIGGGAFASILCGPSVIRKVDKLSASIPHYFTRVLATCPPASFYVPTAGSGINYPSSTRWKALFRG